MARAKHAHLPAVAHDLLHLADRFGMVHAIGAEADIAGPVTKLHRRTTPVPLRVSKIPSLRPSGPRAGRRTGTYGYLVSNKHGMGQQHTGSAGNAGSVSGSNPRGACPPIDRCQPGPALVDRHFVNGKLRRTDPRAVCPDRRG